MFIGMQSERGTTPSGKPRQKLFPDLAPYGNLKPIPKAAPEQEQAIQKPPIFTSQPNIEQRPLSAQFDTTPVPVPAAEVLVRADNKRRLFLARWRLIIIAGFGVIFFAGILFGGWFYFFRSTNPVPVSIAKLVSFPIYYPEQKKLPVGYALDQNSFRSPIKNGIGYAVNYGENQKIVFSVQATPTDNDIQDFNNSYIPERTDFKTPLGQAEIGKFKSQILVSIPIKNGSWVVMTAQPDIDQDKLKTVVRSLRK